MDLPLRFLNQYREWNKILCFLIKFIFENGWNHGNHRGYFFPKT